MKKEVCVITDDKIAITIGDVVVALNDCNMVFHGTFDAKMLLAHKDTILAGLEMLRDELDLKRCEGCK